MITDYFLKFASKEEAVQVFSTIPEHTYTPYDFETNQPLNTLEIVQQTNTFSIDEVGEIYKGGTYDEEGNVIEPPTKLEGYHYNYRVNYGNQPEIPLPVELEPYLVTPKKPKRTFF